MNERIVNAAVLAGLVGGPAAAQRVIETGNDRVLGSAQNGKLRLPRPRTPEDLETTRAWGFVWPEDDCAPSRRLAGRELDVEVGVPEGWSVVATEHWLYKDLLDPRGQVRASLMLHAQDHDSWLTCVPKYRAGVWQKNYSDHEPVWGVVEDSNGQVVWVGKRHEADPQFWQRFQDYWRCRNSGQRVSGDEPKGPRDEALEDACFLLGHLDIDPCDQKWFDEPAVFPDFEDTRPVVSAYRLHTEYRRQPGDHYCADQGSEILNASDDQDAIRLALEGVKTGVAVYHRRSSLFDPSGNRIWHYEDPVPEARTQQRYSAWLDVFGFGPEA